MYAQPEKQNCAALLALVSLLWCTEVRSPAVCIPFFSEITGPVARRGDWLGFATYELRVSN